MSSSGVATQLSHIVPRQSLAIDPRSALNGSGEATLPESHGATHEDSSTAKYAKKRGLAGLVRGLFTPSLLPITTRYDSMGNWETRYLKFCHG